MALYICQGCTTAYAPAAACPHCGADDYFEEGSMPKITVHGGPSNKALYTDTPAPAVAVEAEVTAAEPEAVVVEAEVAASVSVYDTWLLVPLRDECARRGLSKAGNKDELVARLVASDTAPEPEPEPAVAEPAIVEDPLED